MRSNDERPRIQYAWESRVIGQPWRVIVPDGASCGDVSRSARVAFNRWRGADEARAGLGLHIAHAGYTALESDGRRADTLALTLFRLAPHQIRRRPPTAPPTTDAMTSVRARRAERDAAVHVDRRRRYDWQPVHGHTVTVRPHAGAPRYRDGERVRQAWQSWKFARWNRAEWTKEEASNWRVQIDYLDTGEIRATVIDSRLPPPELAPRAVEIDPDTPAPSDW